MVRAYRFPAVLIPALLSRGLGTMTVLLVAAAALAPPAHAQSATAEARFIARARAMMRSMRQESRRDARRIAAAYGGAPAFTDRASLVSARHDGDVAPLPLDERRFNVRPRLTGAHPIGEKDLPHQALYVGARPATLGLLLHVAARVGAPLEVTSLVRHEQYQRALQRTNPNARTAVPTHALGVAFDISILNTPLPAAREIRDVLRRMRDDGDLFFVAETRQLVFHVVLPPEREPFYEAVFAGITSTPAPAWTLPAPSLPAPPAGALVHLIDDDAYGSAAGVSPPAAPFGYATVLLSLALSRLLLARKMSRGDLPR